MFEFAEKKFVSANEPVTLTAAAFSEPVPALIAGSRCTVKRSLVVSRNGAGNLKSLPGAQFQYGIAQSLSSLIFRTMRSNQYKYILCHDQKNSVPCSHLFQSGSAGVIVVP